MTPIARTAAAAALAAAVVITVAGVLEPGYRSLSEGISALASTASHTAVLMTVGFLLLALAALAAGLALWRSIPGRAGRAAAVLVMLAGVATVVDAFARQSCSTLQQSCMDRETAGDVSTAHVVHNLVALVLFAALAAAGFLLVPAARRRGPVLLAATGTLLLIVWFGSGAYGDYGGLVQRLLVIFAYGLPVLTAVRLGALQRRDAYETVATS